MIEKYIERFLLAFLLITSGYVVQAAETKDNDRFSSVSEVSHTAALKNVLQNVYVCTGTYAYAYHSSSECAGLNNCKAEVKISTEDYAVSILRRKPCCRCWSNVENNCKDDYTSAPPRNDGYITYEPIVMDPGAYGGSGAGGSDIVDLALYSIAGAAIIVTSPITLSNDFYVYPTYYMRNYSANKKGLNFGFRKTFKHSALEYGLKYLKDENQFWNGYEYRERNFGGQLNFVHQVFYKRAPGWFKNYIGPTVNYVDHFEYGAIVGTEFKLFDRLLFDVRYEYTTRNSQLQTGLIFKYQKKYFWL